jgi:hypothetical protein
MENASSLFHDQSWRMGIMNATQALPPPPFATKNNLIFKGSAPHPPPPPDPRPDRVDFSVRRIL